MRHPCTKVPPSVTPVIAIFSYSHFAVKSSLTQVGPVQVMVTALQTEGLIND